MDRATRPDDALASLSPSSSSLTRNASSAPTESSPLLIMPSESSQTSQVTASRPKARTIWEDVKAHRRAYVLTAIASFGGMLFGSV